MHKLSYGLNLLSLFLVLNLNMSWVVQFMWEINMWLTDAMMSCGISCATILALNYCNDSPANIVVKVSQTRLAKDKHVTYHHLYQLYLTLNKYILPKFKLLHFFLCRLYLQGSVGFLSLRRTIFAKMFVQGTYAAPVLAQNGSINIPTSRTVIKLGWGWSSAHV